MAVGPVLEALFGNRTAACVLLYLQAYGEGHAMAMARTFGFSLSMVQRQLQRLEANGVLLSRQVGNLRLYAFNQRNPTVRNLRSMLTVELDNLPEDLADQLFSERRRPRRSDKLLRSLIA